MAPLLKQNTFDFRCILELTRKQC